MKHLLISLMVAIIAIAGLIPEAEAKRFGGGRSFGTQRTAPTQPAAPTQNNLSRQQTPQPGTTAPPPRNRSWLGPVAGLAAGLGLAALFSHLGLGEEMATFAMLALLAFGGVMVFRMLTRRAGAAPALPRAAYAGPAPDDPAPNGALHTVGGSAAASDPELAAFDADAFVRQAKLQFIRLQAAHDECNLDDIRAFTTPEVFAEISLQSDERGRAAQRTDILELDAQVVEVAREGSSFVVSVRFSGLLREGADSSAEHFSEIWHLSRSTNGAQGWLIAGIQQLN
ncbi:MAG: Tim44 domain-containing protein [Rhodocyclales bacterium]|nr:Tim44 domain-containing protein [Rhodocyclales bacterium]